jgi:hypothetical protein
VVGDDDKARILDIEVKRQRPGSSSIVRDLPNPLGVPDQRFCAFRQGRIA